MVLIFLAHGHKRPASEHSSPYLEKHFFPQYPPKKFPHFQFAAGLLRLPASSFLLRICRRLALLAHTNV
jgi:hypothetical protein